MLTNYMFFVIGGFLGTLMQFLPANKPYIGIAYSIICTMFAILAAYLVNPQ